MVIYSTNQGDTWDIIAYKVYGNESYMDELIRANPSQVYVATFPAGKKINVPKIDEQRENNLHKPPWMR